ncbi:MAG: PQQ-binding-like beta-propeller repeat protein [Planctomycetaceae bacterium]|nr:PQQ-binding-like beta-propeller repeat protein [Planctomycetaceae bacterium]
MFLAATLSAALPAVAGDWPEFRGPTGQGLSTARRLPTAWSESENVVWKRPIPGLGWSSPVLSGGRIYLTAAVPAENEGPVALRALCLAADSGKILWDREVVTVARDKVPDVHAKNSNASPTPIVYRNRLYVHFGHLGTACLGLDGRVLWLNTELTYAPVHGNGGSPIIAGGGLVFSCDGASDPFIAALGLERGNILWRVPRLGENLPKTFSFATPLLIEVAGTPQVISPGAGSVGALDPQTGAEIWRVRYDGYSVIPRPVYGHGMIYLSTGYDQPKILAIRVDGHGDVTDTRVVWTAARGAPNTPSLLLVGDELYAVSDRGVASCFDAHSGEVHWQERVGGNYSASPVYADGKIYLQTEDGLGIVLKAGQEFEKLAENQLDERTLASYAVDDGVIFIRGDASLYRIEAK